MRQPNQNSPRPVVVIGAGPVGLAAAAHLAASRIDFILLEKGRDVGAHVEEWGHVRMFSPWRYNVDPVARQLLLAVGWQPPADADARPTGRELREEYLRPLANLPQIRDRIRAEAEVVSISRAGLDRGKSDGRDEAPFRVRYRSPEGVEERLEARAVIDASGVWGQPRPLGADGLPALGEAAASGRVHYGVPDLGSEVIRDRYRGKTVAVVGGGDSAFNALLELAALAATAPETKILWVLRGGRPSFGGGTADQLPARGALGDAARRLVEQGQLELVSDFRISEVEALDAAIRLISENGVERVVEEVVCVTGFRPDLSLSRELRLSLDPVTEAPIALGPLIDPNVHSCGSVPPHGYRELSHDGEPGMYVVGMKSYGRAPTFLLLTGYEQVRSVVAAVAGDLEGAAEVRLELPETGVCSTDFVPGPAQGLKVPPPVPLVAAPVESVVEDASPTATVGTGCGCDTAPTEEESRRLRVACCGAA